MKNLYLYLVIVFTSILISCSTPTDYADEAITVYKLNNQLKIVNNTNNTLYLFVIDRGVLALINWAPHFDDPKILKNGFIYINYADIWNGQERPVQSGDEIVVNFWDDSDKANPIVNNKVIKL